VEAVDKALGLVVQRPSNVDIRVTPLLPLVSQNISPSTA
jgi:hypothetical protein